MTKSSAAERRERLFGVPTEFRDQVLAAAERSELRDAVRAVYARLQTEIDRRKPICVASGKCCHFEEYGHRLFVTTLEMAAFLQELPLADLRMGTAASAKPQAEKTSKLNILTNPGGCRFQIEGLCSVHAIRPFGCRIFFCDSTATDWQQQQYEIFHAELKQLHQTFNVEYFYVEWRQALAAVFPADSL